MTITFAAGVSGAGAQIQQNAFGQFVAEIQAFDAGSNLLGSFTANGNSTTTGDDSAIFIGILSDIANIKSISFNVSNRSDFAIGNVELKTTGDVVVPEPGSVTLLLSGMLAMAGVSIRRRRKVQANEHV